MSSTTTTTSTSSTTTPTIIPGGPTGALAGAQQGKINTATIPNYKNWTVVYPQYINSELTRDQGRRTPKDKSVKNPQLEEIAKCAGAVGLSAVLEPHKGYPSDFFQRGRVKIQMLNEQKQPFVSTITNKTELLLFLAEKINLVAPNRPENFNPLCMIPTLTQQPAVKKDKEDKKNKKKGK
ncbi:hypothetical protein SAMD00019534_054850 [Acytostelium subglobosum LB1]|uniref:hypothetical protein n=1 Tax=Acytostelium subglobosum LB1 TaxID=1410327 RepID=UPI000644E02B|nr:hypothetical protein SAMD00019534_054850 [Acytostelium subglobosum LB1]GAM22310.1 hypothetical protein SAMD00019534_054850 [Acytostelium subglobosum LB1]|eukprot:XP_012754430.1 hypothetical protein SAMD00019534_054850 [Acytostelium subglobosum LB1]